MSRVGTVRPRPRCWRSRWSRWCSRWCGCSSCGARVARQAEATGWDTAWDTLRRSSIREVDNPWGVVWVAVRRAVLGEKLAAAYVTEERTAWRIHSEGGDGRRRDLPRPPRPVSLDALAAVGREQCGLAQEAEPPSRLIDHLTAAFVDAGWPPALARRLVRQIALTAPGAVGPHRCGVRVAAPGRGAGHRTLAGPSGHSGRPGLCGRAGLGGASAPGGRAGVAAGRRPPAAADDGALPQARGPGRLNSYPTRDRSPIPPLPRRRSEGRQESWQGSWQGGCVTQDACSRHPPRGGHANRCWSGVPTGDSAGVGKGPFGHAWSGPPGTMRSIGRIGVRRWLRLPGALLATAVLAVGVSACSGDDQPGPARSGGSASSADGSAPASPGSASSSTAASSSPSEASAVVDPATAQAVLAAYRGYWAERVTAQAAPSEGVPKASGDVRGGQGRGGRRVVGGVVRAAGHRDPRRAGAVADGDVGDGRATRRRPRSPTASTPRTGRRCSPRPGKSALAPGQPTRVVVESTASTYDGRWVIRTSTAFRDRTC